jgi:hypothetical protein
MNNLSSYCELVDARIRDSDKDLPLQLQITNQLNTLKMSLIHMFCDVDGPWIVVVSYLEQNPCPMAMEELAKFPFPENSSAMAFVMVTRYHSYIT